MEPIENDDIGNRLLLELVHVMCFESETHWHPLYSLFGEVRAVFFDRWLATINSDKKLPRMYDKKVPIVGPPICFLPYYINAHGFRQKVIETSVPVEGVPSDEEERDYSTMASIADSKEYGVFAVAPKCMAEQEMPILDLPDLHSMTGVFLKPNVGGLMVNLAFPQSTRNASIRAILQEDSMQYLSRVRKRVSRQWRDLFLTSHRTKTSFPILQFVNTVLHSCILVISIEILQHLNTTQTLNVLGAVIKTGIVWSSRSSQPQRAPRTSVEAALVITEFVVARHTVRNAISPQVSKVVQAHCTLACIEYDSYTLLSRDGLAPKETSSSYKQIRLSNKIIGTVCVLSFEEFMSASSAGRWSIDSPREILGQVQVAIILIIRFTREDLCDISIATQYHRTCGPFLSRHAISSRVMLWISWTKCSPSLDNLVSYGIDTTSTKTSTFLFASLEIVIHAVLVNAFAALHLIDRGFLEDIWHSAYLEILAKKGARLREKCEQAEARDHESDTSDESQTEAELVSSLSPCYFQQSGQYANLIPNLRNCIVAILNGIAFTIDMKCSPLLVNFVSYGIDVLKARPDYRHKVGDDDEVNGCKFAESMLPNLRDHIDDQLQHIIAIAADHIDKGETSTFLLANLEIVIDAVLVNASAAVHFIDLGSHACSLTAGSRDQHREKLPRVHDNKLNIVALWRWKLL
ncbi:hypothetical protein K503DRAFT_845204 [Rhizopogon vinicolor AM-OR11-026]|uniref:Uncharacterized protein n=1 Tax=Rhizopogon vinicolor AM-OR11-026 TaxID=1314800 RepID=A0A1B7MHT9_9AGAM|nr:hypothetical protein K503DRAFT_845204 [Rhizopogon vinicolor AM-OR11-026]